MMESYTSYLTHRLPTMKAIPTTRKVEKYVANGYGSRVSSLLPKEDDALPPNAHADHGEDVMSELVDPAHCRSQSGAPA